MRQLVRRAPSADQLDYLATEFRWESGLIFAPPGGRDAPYPQMTFASCNSNLLGGSVLHSTAGAMGSTQHCRPRACRGVTMAGSREHSPDRGKARGNVVVSV
jgi:hypothetical protein